ncbi:hypothetical protein Salat_0313600 [Sesamum alatum]|uniref:Senescence regulator n=1 Tax=Sesamum alatum TaxID=300844 RepID=A0AAE2CYY3_9LAMI|nr:hypothetical protein Salat_0313600 [Sesamum alatum]
MENMRYGLCSRGSSGWTSLRNEEFHEEDVWGVFKERKDSDSRAAMIMKQPSFVSKRLPTATRMIPKSSSSNKNDPAAASQEPKLFQQHSAPVNIPDWSKIYGRNNTSTSSWLDSDSGGDGNGRSSWESGEEEEEEEDDGDGDVIPPHEWIARKQASSRTSSFSVCEGAGRTLKGRDLSRVRNAVLRKTGFLESKPDY